MGGEEVLHHHHVGVGHGVDGVVGIMVPHHCVAGVGEVAHYLHLTPGGDHVDVETHGGGGCHGVDVHLDHGEWADDHHGHVGDGGAHLVGDVGCHVHWRGESVGDSHGEVVVLD
jgi:hypothetical protein